MTNLLKAILVSASLGLVACGDTASIVGATYNAAEAMYFAKNGASFITIDTDANCPINSSTIETAGYGFNTCLVHIK